METYHAEQKKPPTEQKGARAVCDEVTRAHCRSTGMDVPLSHSTLLRLAAGRQSQGEFNAGKRWLEPAEDAALLQYTSNWPIVGSLSAINEFQSMQMSFCLLVWRKNSSLLARIGPNNGSLSMRMSSTPTGHAPLIANTVEL